MTFEEDEILSLSTSKELSPYKSLYNNHDNNSDIEQRIRTLIFAPMIYAVQREKLAERGFMLTAHKTIECYLCSGKLDDIKYIDDIGEKHNEQCQFYQPGEYGAKGQTKKARINIAALSAEEKENMDIEDIKNEIDHLKREWLCPVCKTETCKTLFLPCRHIGACEDCSERMVVCFHCQEVILGTVKIYKV